jgi:hypothetical protein
MVSENNSGSSAGLEARGLGIELSTMSSDWSIICVPLPKQPMRVYDGSGRSCLERLRLSPKLCNAIEEEYIRIDGEGEHMHATSRKQSWYDSGDLSALARSARSVGQSKSNQPCMQGRRVDLAHRR